MKNSSIFAVTSVLLAASAHASDPAECRARIAEMLQTIAPQPVAGPRAEGLKKQDSADEQYRLSADRSCGVEYLSDRGHLTVTRFGETKLEKFETILLDETELTSGGRVRATVECSIQGDSVFFETRLPIFSDGVRTPYQQKFLEVTRNADGKIYVFVEARLALLRSKIDCLIGK